MSVTIPNKQQLIARKNMCDKRSPLILMQVPFLILITYIIMYFFNLFGYIYMFVFAVRQINCSESLSPKLDV